MVCHCCRISGWGARDGNHARAKASVMSQPQRGYFPQALLISFYIVHAQDYILIYGVPMSVAVENKHARAKELETARLAAI
jgi:hypothetical protein